MERRKKLIEATFGVVIEVTESSELTPQKVLNWKTVFKNWIIKIYFTSVSSNFFFILQVKKCKQLVIQKHQLSLYHNSRKDLKKVRMTLVTTLKPNSLRACL